MTSHGHHRPVTEPVWTFSLFYSSATLLLTPAIMFLVATRFVAASGEVSTRSRSGPSVGFACSGQWAGTGVWVCVLPLVIRLATLAGLRPSEERT